jgi:acetyl esterase
MTLEPIAQAFINSLTGPPLSQLSPADAHKVLTDLQSLPVPLQDAHIEDTVWPVGPTGETRIRIVRPAKARAEEVLPVIFYTHGGGWVLGDKITHDRLVREIANGVGATVIFVDLPNPTGTGVRSARLRASSSRRKGSPATRRTRGHYVPIDALTLALAS